MREIDDAISSIVPFNFTTYIVTQKISDLFVILSIFEKNKFLRGLILKGTKLSRN